MPFTYFYLVENVAKPLAHVYIAVRDREGLEHLLEADEEKITTKTFYDCTKHLFKSANSSKKEKSTPRPRNLGLKLCPNKNEAFT